MVETKSGRFYVHSNQQYSVMAISNAAGEVVERRQYGPYGEIEVNEEGVPPVELSVGYTGLQYDPDIKMLYARNRWFSPSLGRWVNRDRAGYVDGMSLYRAYFVPGGLDPSGNTTLTNIRVVFPQPRPGIPGTWTRIQSTISAVTSRVTGGIPHAMEAKYVRDDGCDVVYRQWKAFWAQPAGNPAYQVPFFASVVKQQPVYVDYPGGPSRVLPPTAGVIDKLPPSLHSDGSNPSSSDTYGTKVSISDVPDARFNGTNAAAPDQGAGVRQFKVFKTCAVDRATGINISCFHWFVFDSTMDGTYLKVEGELGFPQANPYKPGSFSLSLSPVTTSSPGLVSSSTLNPGIDYVGPPGVVAPSGQASSSSASPGVDNVGP
jgi:RHS repeat-associated protein